MIPYLRIQGKSEISSDMRVEHVTHDVSEMK